MPEIVSDHGVGILGGHLVIARLNSGRHLLVVDCSKAGKVLEDCLAIWYLMSCVGEIVPFLGLSWLERRIGLITIMNMSESGFTHMT